MSSPTTCTQVTAETPAYVIAARSSDALWAFADGARLGVTHSQLAGGRASPPKRRSSRIMVLRSAPDLAQVLAGKAEAEYQEPAEYGNLLARREGAERRFVHYDGLGSTRRLTNQNENESDSFLYDAWRRLVNRTGQSQWWARYVGRQQYITHEGSGLLYVRAR